jgi:AcrR family transcriptional regulator
MSIEKLILDTAENLFNHHGYTNVGVDLIRDTSGVSKTTLYRHFSDKDGLIIATLNRRHKRFSESLAKAVADEDDVDNKLLALLNWHYDWFNSHHFDGCMFMHALSEFKGKNNSISQIAIEHKIWVKNLIDSALKGQKSLYHHSKTDFIMNTIEGLIINAEFFKTPPSIKIFADTLLHVANAKIPSL